jgi:hypothetical protein
MQRPEEAIDMQEVLTPLQHAGVCFATGVIGSSFLCWGTRQWDNITT